MLVLRPDEQGWTPVEVLNCDSLASELSALRCDSKEQANVVIRTGAWQGRLQAIDVSPLVHIDLDADLCVRFAVVKIPRNPAHTAIVTALVYLVFILLRVVLGVILIALLL